MKKKPDECLFCRSRNCCNRIVSSEDNGKVYDEVACGKHCSDLDKHSDRIAPGIMKYFISSTGGLSRGVKFEVQEDEV